MVPASTQKEKGQLGIRNATTLQVAGSYSCPAAGHLEVLRGSPQGQAAWDSVGMEGEARLQAWDTHVRASFLVSASRLRAKKKAREATSVVSHSPGGQANRSQGRLYLLWPLWRAQDAGTLQLSCRTSRSPPGEGRKELERPPKVGGRGGS